MRPEPEILDYARPRLRRWSVRRLVMRFRLWLARPEVDVNRPPRRQLAAHLRSWFARPEVDVRGLPRPGPAIRWRLWVVPPALAALLAVIVILWRLSHPAGPASRQPAPPPRSLESYAEREENLASNIEKYYEATGGLEVACELAEQASRDHPLSEFPPLNYDRLSEPYVIILMRGPLRGDPSSPAIGKYFPRIQGIVVDASNPVRQLTIEHELTHAWQFAEIDPIRNRGKYAKPLGDVDRLIARVAELRREDAVRDRAKLAAYVEYLATPIELDPRLAAFKRWWTRIHGELLDSPEAIRHAAEQEPLHNAPREVGEFHLIWQMYRDQPKIREYLLLRMLQLVNVPGLHGVAEV